MTLSEYLRARGLYLEPIKKDIDPILEDEALTKEAAELWETKSNLITMILQARINAIGKQMLENSPPEEVMVLRQSMVEIGAIISDFEVYKGVYGRNKAPEPQENSADGAETPTPPKEGEENTL